MKGYDELGTLSLSLKLKDPDNAEVILEVRSTLI